MPHLSQTMAPPGATIWWSAPGSASAQAQPHLERMQKWVFGGYTLRLGTEGPKVEMDAAVGLAEAHTGESIKDLLARADVLMYKQKAELHKRRATPSCGKN